MEGLSALHALDVRLKNMTLEEKLEKIVTEDAHNAYLLLVDMGPGDWREEPDRHYDTIANFRATFDDCVKKIEASLGPHPTLNASIRSAHPNGRRWGFTPTGRLRPQTRSFAFSWGEMEIPKTQ